MMPPTPLALLLLLCGGGPRLAAGQSNAADKASMLAFKAGGDDNDNMASWTAATDPCGDGWDDFNAGWVGVTCCANGYDVCGGVSTNTGRVTVVNLSGWVGGWG